MIRFAFAAVGLAVCFSAAMAQSDPIAERKAAMKAVGVATGLGTKIAKGEEAYDTIKVQGIFKVFADAAKKVPTLFPTNSKTGGETTASPKIWDDQAAFLTAFVNFDTDAKAGAQVTDLEGFRIAFGNLTKNCGICHETYRIKK